MRYCCFFLFILLFTPAFTGCAHVYVLKSGFYKPAPAREPKIRSRAVLVFSSRATERLFLGGSVLGADEVDVSGGFRRALRAELSSMYARVEISSSAYKPPRLSRAAASRSRRAPVLVYPSAWLNWRGAFFPSGTLLLQMIVEAPDLGRRSVFWTASPYRPRAAAFVPFFFPLCDPVLAGCPLYDEKQTRACGSALETALAGGLKALAPEMRREARKISSLRRAAAFLDSGKASSAIKAIAQASVRDGFDEDLGCRAVLAAHSPGLSFSPRLPGKALDLASRARAAMDGRSPDLDQAVHSMEAALRLAPWWSDGFYDLAALLAKSGRYYEASESLLCFLRSGPANAKAVALRIADLRNQAVSDPAARLGPLSAVAKGAVHMPLPAIEGKMLDATGLVRLMGLALRPGWCFWENCHKAKAASVMRGSPAWSAGFRQGDDFLVDVQRRNAGFVLPFILSAWPGEVVPVVTF